MDNAEDPSTGPVSLLDAFRMHYSRLESVVHEAVSNPTDSVVLERIDNDLSEYLALVEEVSMIDNVWAAIEYFFCTAPARILEFLNKLSWTHCGII